MWISKTVCKNVCCFKKEEGFHAKKSLGPLIPFLEGSFFMTCMEPFRGVFVLVGLYSTALFYNLNSVVLVEVTQQHCLETNSNLNTPIGLDQLPPKNFVSFFIMRNARKWSKLKGYCYTGNRVWRLKFPEIDVIRVSKLRKDGYTYSNPSLLDQLMAPRGAIRCPFGL